MNHIERTRRHEAYMVSVGAPMTADHLTTLGNRFAHSARCLKPHAKRGTLSYNQRRAALESARAYYTLARRYAVARLADSLTNFGAY